MSRSFGLDAPAALEALRSAVERFKEDDLDVELARDCAGKAWHLCDHVFMALGTNSVFGKLRVLQEHVREACPELAYLQDICIESKHAQITMYTPRIDAARVHVGDFSREDFSSDDFDTSRLEIVLHGGRAVSFNNVVDRAVEFWSDFMEAHGIR